MQAGASCFKWSVVVLFIFFLYPELHFALVYRNDVP